MSKRARDDSPDAAAHQNKKRKLHSYSVDFKINAITFHKQGNSKEATARKFGVDSKRIREWCKQEDKLQAAKTGGNVSTPTKQRKRLDGGGRKPLSETLETELYQWIEEKRSLRLRVTRKAVQIKAIDIFTQLGDDGQFVDDSDDEDDIPLAHIL